MNNPFNDKKNLAVAQAVKAIIEQDIGSPALPSILSDKELLIKEMKRILADTVVLYFKAHTYHWNVVGSNFPQYHAFFDTVYTEIYGMIDPTAEHIRSLGEFAPVSLRNVLDLAYVQENQGLSTSAEMFDIMITNNRQMIGCLKEGIRLANIANEDGVSNFLQDRLDKHNKLDWQLKSTAKGLL